jgi:hypothetical protein
VLQDWHGGRIPYFTAPPAAPAPGLMEEAAVVSGWGKAFDVDAIEQVVIYIYVI